jgi:hypothetical protein
MNWKSIIATALITGAVTVATGMLLFWWQSEKSELTYNSIQSIPFDDSNNKLFIQQIEIANSGDKVIEDVVFVLTFSNEKIQKSKITVDKAISHQKKSDDSSIELKIDMLNPKEGAGISVLFQSSKASTSGGAVSLRGKGVTGILIGSRNKSSKMSIFISLMAAYAGILAFFLSTRFGRKAFPILLKNVFLGVSLGSTGQQKDVIASLLAMYGYPEKAKEYLQAGASRQYWVEADLLASEAINSNDKTKKDTIEILKQLSKVEVMFSESKAIVLYNIARIAKSSDLDSSIVDQNLDLARKLCKREVEKRLKIDPIFRVLDKTDNMLHVDAPCFTPVS